MNNKPYESLRYFALALDPIHVGTGGMRLGRVDMSIVREPGTNLPKIPGTSLSGVARTYAAMQENGKFPQCAGQGGHCGQPDCPICVTFGFAGTQNGSFQGLAQFSDARLLFFPVHSLAGPVWVTCPAALRDLEKDLEITVDEPADEQVRVAKDVKQSGRLNLGWLMLEVADNNLTLNLPNAPQKIQTILNHAVLVSNKMFSHIVNDNLEVRTSVSIDPQTGAAAEGALFTYETESVIPLSDNNGHPEGNIDKVKSTVNNGLKLFEFLGVGGMNTRGMGRLCVSILSEGGAQ
jgi:CRISPR-associated protein Cmr4